MLRSLWRWRFRTAGSWVFEQPIVSWLSDRQLVSQLPWPYRLFASYCALQRGRPFAAETVFRIIGALRGLGGEPEPTPLRLGDTTVFLDLRDSRSLNVPSELTSGLPQILKHFLRPGDTFVDVGANHGAFSVVAAGIVGEEGLVVAIEPQPYLAHLVERSLAANRARFEVHSIACGDSVRSAKFYVPYSSSGSAGFFEGCSARVSHRTIEVHTQPLNTVIDPARLPGRVFMKIDVEGSELACLRGARRLIQDTRPTLLIEVNPATMQAAGTCAAQLAATLRELGYDCFANAKDLDTVHFLGADLPAGDVVCFPAPGT